MNLNLDTVFFLLGTKELELFELKKQVAQLQEQLKKPDTEPSSQTDQSIPT